MSVGEVIEVSVVMPVYNSEAYVGDAIGSVLSQDFECFELLIIDDGSTDRSGIICDTYASADSRVRVLHIPNGGMCHARNLAIEHARGEYIAFCDNDDQYLPGLLSDNYVLAKNSKADCVRFGRRVVTHYGEGGSQQIDEAKPERTTILYGKEIDENLSLLFYGSNGVWNGLYRRAFLLDNKIRFTEELRHGSEDIIFNLDVFCCAGTICLNADTYYVWHRRLDHSASFVLGDNYFVGIALQIHRLAQLLEVKGRVAHDQRFIANCMIWPFRQIVGTVSRLRGVTFSEYRHICNSTRVVYEGYWTKSMSDNAALYGRVLDLIMGGYDRIPAASIFVWHLWQGLRRRFQNT